MYLRRNKFGRLQRHILWSIVRDDSGKPAMMRFHGEGQVQRRRKPRKEVEAQCRRIGERARRIGKWPPLWVIKTWRKSA